MEYNLNRFLKAQENDYQIALSEIKSGRKKGHWIWYIFPQLKGMGKSSTSQYYGIEDFKEAVEYYNHPILGKRLVEIADVFFELDKKDPEEILGRPDDKKLKSCMTLFDAVARQERNYNNVFSNVIYKFYGGKYDRKTIQKLGGYGTVGFILFRFTAFRELREPDKYIFIETILATDKYGHILEIVHRRESHYDNLSDGDEELLPKTGEHFYYDSKKRIEAYVKKMIEWSALRLEFEIIELSGLDDYVRELLTNH